MCIHVYHLGLYVNIDLIFKSITFVMSNSIN